MFIVEQNRDSVTNTDHFGTIETDGIEIDAYLRDSEDNWCETHPQGSS